MKTVSFYTLGCKVNTYDSTYMKEQFEKKGYRTVSFGKPSDIVVVNTCTVTGTADKKSRSMIRRAAKLGKVIVAGCMAQKDSKNVLDFEGVYAAVGTDDRKSIADIADEILLGKDSINNVRNIDKCGFEEMSVTTPGERTRGTIKIQEGCNNFCSYCIIPYVRGRSRSRKLNEIVKEAQTLASGGAKELVLTGIHIASYNDDGKDLADVVKELDGLDVRIRLGSLETGIIDEDFVKRLSYSENLCPHFHLSLQSGSKTVLKRMNRKYTPQEYLKMLELLRKHFDTPAITTDVITGFPGETIDEFRETAAFIEAAGFSRLHVFPFSAREGTKAYDMKPKVPIAAARERAKQLISIGDKLEQEYLNSLIGRTEEVLFEEESKVFPGLTEGYSKRYVRVAAMEEKENEVRSCAARRDKERRNERRYYMNDCLFCKIVEGKIPSNKVYEDETVLAFHDIDPQAPVHVLIIPKKHIKSVARYYGKATLTSMHVSSAWRRSFRRSSGFPAATV